MTPSLPRWDRANVVTVLVAQALDDLHADRLALEQALTLVAQMAWDAGTKHALANQRPTAAGVDAPAEAADSAQSRIDLGARCAPTAAQDCRSEEHTARAPGAERPLGSARPPASRTRSDLER